MLGKRAQARADTFNNKANLIHYNKYNYSLVNYSKASNKVIIICPTHGDFTQIPSNHLAGKGCKRCSPGGGFDWSKAGILYYLSIDDGAYFKIGITNRTVLERYSKDEHPRIKILHEWHYPVGRDAAIHEKSIKALHKDNLIPRDTLVLRNGNTEIFASDVLGLHKEEK